MGLTPNEALSEFHPFLKIQGVLALLESDRVEEKANCSRQTRPLKKHL